MAEEDQEKHSTPSLYRRIASPLTEDEAISMEFKQTRHRYRKHFICCGIISAVVLILVVILLVLSFTLFHVKNPEINLNSVILNRFNSIPFLSPTNLTVTADVSVKNPNAASFRFNNSTATLSYKGKVIGESDIPAGVAKARRTVRLNLTFEVVLAELTAVRGFGIDLTAGVIPVTSYTSIEGRVKILNVIKKSVTVRINCSMIVNITSQAIQDQKCKRHVSL